MSKNFQLQIPTPCHENWDNMSPVEKGRFCSSCQKQVVDFSKMSDRDIAMFFKKPSTGSVCGRFMEDQLYRDIEIPKKRIPWLKYFFHILLPGLLVSMKATAQGKVRVISTTDTAKVSCTSRMLGEVSFAPIKGDTILTGPTITAAPIGKKNVASTIETSNLGLQKTNASIKGRVINNNNEGIPYATVSVNGNLVVADSLGYYVFNGLFDKDAVVKASSVGYYSNEITIESKGTVINQDITLNVDEILNEVIVQSNATKGRVVMGAVASGIVIRYYQQNEIPKKRIHHF